MRNGCDNVRVDFSKGFNSHGMDKLADTLPVNDICRRKIKHQAKAISFIMKGVFSLPKRDKGEYR